MIMHFGNRRHFKLEREHKLPAVVQQHFVFFFPPVEHTIGDSLSHRFNPLKWACFSGPNDIGLGTIETIVA